MMAVLVLFAFFLAGYLRWCRRLYWQMRMDEAADCAALSAARAQAEMLNRIAVKNAQINQFLPKVGYGRESFSVIPVENYIKLLRAKKELGRDVSGFRRFPAGVGFVVARLNAATGPGGYWPMPMDPYLASKDVHAILVNKMPPAFYYKYVEKAFYARTWGPGARLAQPPHKTTWLVSRNGIRSQATARLWLDVPSHSFFGNGGFPRVKESLLGGVGIQSQFPQFNAQLAPTLQWKTSYSQTTK